MSLFPLPVFHCQCYHSRVLNTPLTRLRKDAPGGITLARVEAFFKRRRFPRGRTTISEFERGTFKEPPERFVELYAEAIGSTVSRVSDALARTQRQRASGTGPFGRRSAA